jgi:DNA-directed RNA polymerase specialized sigma24 family protein
MEQLVEVNSFAEMMARVRRSDPRAAHELLDRYGDQIRRVVRVRLTDPSLRRQMDSVDICQSVMADFFVRVALGQYELNTPEQLVKLLATMARNRLFKHIDGQRAARRDVRRLEKVGVDELPVAAGEPTPSRHAAGRELLAEVRLRLTEQECYLADQRGLGRSWPELAEELGATADALRIRLRRALDRVCQELNLDDLITA